MARNESGKPPLGFWIAAILSTLWSLGGCTAYHMQVGMSGADLAKLPVAQQEIWRMMPAWVTAAYAIAVWTGLAGSLSLLLRMSWARYLFACSLIAVLVQFGWTFLATPIMATVGPSAISLPACIVAAAILLIWFAGFATRRGWLR